MMRKVRDYVHLFEGFTLDDEDLGSRRHGVCRVRIYQQREDLVGEDDRQCQDWQCPAPVALISELPDNPNVDVSELIEVLAAELCAAHAIPTDTTTFVVHYDRTDEEIGRGIPETYSILEFSDRRLGLQAVEGEIRLSFGEPYFTHVAGEAVRETIGCEDTSQLQPHSGRHGDRHTINEEVMGDAF